MYRVLAFAVAVCTVSSCSGTMQGIVRGSGEKVQFVYEQGIDHDKLTTVIDGEAFAGKAVMRGATTVVGNAFGSTTAGANAAFSTMTMIGSQLTGDFVAILLGSNGSTLSCQLQYADASGFTTSGGVGTCQHSDGRLIDIVW